MSLLHFSWHRLYHCVGSAAHSWEFQEAKPLQKLSVLVWAIFPFTSVLQYGNMLNYQSSGAELYPFLFILHGKGLVFHCNIYHNTTQRGCAKLKDTACWCFNLAWHWGQAIFFKDLVLINNWTKKRWRKAHTWPGQNKPKEYPALSSHKKCKYFV